MLSATTQKHQVLLRDNTVFPPHAAGSTMETDAKLWAVVNELKPKTEKFVKSQRGGRC